MTKKKKFESLEAEFEEIKRIHKVQIVATALFMYEKEDIYDHRLFKKYKNWGSTGLIKGREIAHDFEIQYLQGNTKPLEQAYKYCFKKVKPYLFEDTHFDKI